MRLKPVVAGLVVFAVVAVYLRQRSTVVAPSTTPIVVRLEGPTFLLAGPNGASVRRISRVDIELDDAVCFTSKGELARFRPRTHTLELFSHDGKQVARLAMPPVPDYAAVTLNRAGSKLYLMVITSYGSVPRVVDEDLRAFERLKHGERFFVNEATGDAVVTRISRGALHLSKADDDQTRVSELDLGPLHSFDVYTYFKVDPSAKTVYVGAGNEILVYDYQGRLQRVHKTSSLEGLDRFTLDTINNRLLVITANSFTDEKSLMSLDLATSRRTTLLSQVGTTRDYSAPQALTKNIEAWFR